MLRRLHHAFVQVPRRAHLTRTLGVLAGPATSLLDVGAGDGALGVELAREIGATTVHGADILAQPGSKIPVSIFAGDTLPFEDASFDLVLLADVLHHADAPARLLREAARVARRCVLVKDHFAFGEASRRLLHALDVAANRRYGIAVSGNYLTPASWVALCEEGGVRVEALHWPLRVHPAPIRALVPSSLHFAARLGKAAP